MRITQKQLRQIIKEEVQKRIQEGFGDDSTFATTNLGDRWVDPRYARADFAARKAAAERQERDRTRRAELRAQGTTRWDAVYDIVRERIDSNTGPGGMWRMTGYRPNFNEPRGSTHMMEGNYSGLYEYIGPTGPFGPDYRGGKPLDFSAVGRVRDWNSDSQIFRDERYRFLEEFEFNFPGAANQRKIDDRRPGGPGTNRTRMDMMMIPIPYFEDFKEVIVTWVTNMLTGENRPIPWPADQGLT